MRLRIFISLCLFLSLFKIASQQLPSGSWRFHFSYKNTRLCEAANDYVYAASGPGFFKVHKSSFETVRLTTFDGFHGKEITHLAFSPEKNVLLIGYVDGYIDILKNENEITGISGFYYKLLQGDKSILHASFTGKYALVSTNFGILQIDLDKHEIKESYTSIGVSAILSTAILGDSIYAGIQTGILAAPFNDVVNLNNSANWHPVYTGAPCNYLTSFADSLYFYSDSTAYNYKKGIVKKMFTNGNASYVKIKKTTDASILFFRQGGITKMGTAGNFNFTKVNIIGSGTVDNAGAIWFTTGIGGGLIKNTAGGEIAFEPNGPSNNSVFAMTKESDFLFCTGGGVSNTFGNAYNAAGFYIYNNFQWESNPSSVFNVNLYDYTFTHYNKKTKRTYVGTHTNGMLEFSGKTAIQKFDENNSTLFREIGSGFIRVSGIASDDTGNTWVISNGSSKPINVLSKTGTWTSIPIPSGDNSFKFLVIDQNGFKWMALLAGGVAVFDDNKTPGKFSDDRYIKLNTSHGLITNDITSIAADRNGYVWIGTSQGLNVVTSTFEVFNRPKADRFVIEQNGTIGNLLGEETINDICVDGGNRKWFATNNGVFLVAPDGQEVLSNFTAENSPLPENKVICIGQTETIGEIFFGTENGIISYRSDASSADDKFKEIKIYPNPVKPGYAGLVTIEGLAQDAEIRITDAAGVLIYQTKANGGTATWPCTRLDGSKPNSGVLYVFGINTEGTETAMGKFIFIK